MLIDIPTEHVEALAELLGEFKARAPITRALELIRVPLSDRPTFWVDLSDRLRAQAVKETQNDQTSNKGADSNSDIQINRVEGRRIRKDVHRKGGQAVDVGPLSGSV